MSNINLEEFEEKYPGISEKEGWLDLHVKRGSKEIDDENFKIEIMKFGVEELDADNYIQYLIGFNETITDVIEDGKFMEMIELSFKYEGFDDKKDAIKEMVKNDQTVEARKLLQDEFAMTEEEIDNVISSLKFEIKIESE